MKKFLTVLTCLSLLAVPVLVGAQVPVGWSATSTDAGFIKPNKVNGNIPHIKVPYIVATSTTATSTFAKNVNIGSVENLEDGLLTIYSNTFLRGGLKLTEQVGTYTLLNSNGDEFNLIIYGSDDRSGGEIHILNLGGFEVDPYCLGVDPDGCLKTFINNSPVVTITDYKTATKDLWGNIGISSTTPYGRLTVNATSTQGNPALLITSTGTGDLFQAWDGSNKVFTIEDGGNVGVGVANPTVALDVVGGTDIQGGTSLLQVGASEILANNAVVRIGDIEGAGTGQHLKIEDGEFEFNSGNVGIGTTTPGTLLSIGNTGSNTINLNTTSTSTLGTGINIRSGCFSINETCVGLSTVGAGTTGQFPYYASNGVNLTATSTLFLSTGGNIGVGTTSPYEKLSVSGAVVGTYFTASGNATSTFVGGVAVATSTKPLFNVDKFSGKVGIGTSTPNGTLGVNGIINIQNENAHPSTYSTFNIENAPDEQNTNSSALYIYPRDLQNQRVFIGKSGSQVYALNLSRVLFLEGVPYSIRSTGSADAYYGLGSQNVFAISNGTNGGNIVLAPGGHDNGGGGSRGFITGFESLGLSSLGYRTMQFKSYAADSDASPNATYIFDTNANNSTVQHTLWKENGTTFMSLDASGQLGVGTSTPRSLLHVEDQSATSTAVISTKATSKGGRLILEDVDGAGCTEVTALDGVLSAKIVTCPTGI